MVHPLTLELPDEIYQPLLRSAERTGRTPENLVTDWLRDALDQQTLDPLLRLSGSLKFERSDICERHDEYIGAGILNEKPGMSNG